MLTACMSFPVSGLFETVFCDPMADRKQGVIRSVRVPTGNVRVPTGNVTFPTGNVRVSTGNVRVSTGNVRVPTENAMLYIVSLNQLSFNCIISPRRRSGAFVGV